MALVKVCNGAYTLQSGEDGLFIPLTAVKGLDIGEIDPNDSSISDAVRQSKSIFAIIDRIAEYVLDPESKVLGMTATKGNLTGGSSSTFSVPYSFVCSSLINIVDSVIDSIPAPISGTNKGVGVVPMSSLFTFADVFAPGVSTQYSGLLIPFAEIAPYLNPSGLRQVINSNDARGWVNAFLEAASQYPNLTRATGVQSAFTARAAVTNGASAIPAAMIAATNPTTGIVPANANKFALFNRTYNFTVQFALNPTVQSYDLAVI